MSTSPRRRRRRAPWGRPGSFDSWRRVIGAAVGVLLLTAAVWAVWSRGSVVEDAWNTMREAPAWLVGGALVLPLASWLLTAAAFWLLTRRYARVPASDMVQLIGAAWLLNHLPLRPGMVGRVAFHKKYHGMAVGDSIRVMVAAMVCSGVSLGLLLVAAVGVSRVESTLWTAACLAGPTVGVGAVALFARAVGASWWREVAALGVRSLDMLAWVGRYAIVFALVGQDVSVERLVIVAAVCQVAMLVPLTGNGIGLREWAVGLTLAALAGSAATIDVREQAAAIGLAADLLNRAAETVLAVPVGLACSWLLARKVRRGRGG
ncbi:MAG: lysylphosphatidylglycerol synthase domain-containing protein [Planctomycetota bacterium]|nr:lysylphosphatidylglycerol synthase domain-containing protein [Planctomycetota bacterium]